MRSEKEENKSGNQGRMAEEKEIRRRNGELENLKNEFGKLGGAGHFWGNDKGTDAAGVRDQMGESELKKVLRLVAAGETKINLKERESRAFLSEKKLRETQKKFHIYHNWKVAEVGWTIQFKTVSKEKGGDGKYFYLWLEQKGKNLNLSFF